MPPKRRAAAAAAERIKSKSGKKKERRSTAAGARTRRSVRTQVAKVVRDGNVALQEATAQAVAAENAELAAGEPMSQSAGDRFIGGPLMAMGLAMIPPEHHETFKQTWAAMEQDAAVVRGDSVWSAAHRAYVPASGA
jgi:hypothetical protein